jgi:thioesterase domain-containing protein
MYDLGRHLSRDRPFYGLQAAGVDGTTRPKATIEEMAEAYLAELRIVQPKGPYYLSGYCGGGLVAYEMAQRLRAGGETVALLMLIELYRPGVTPIDSVTGWKRLLTQEGLRELMTRLRKKITRKVNYVTRSLAVRYHLSRGGPMPYALRDFWLTRSFMRSAARYQVQPYHGKLTVIRAREIDPLFAKVISDLGWTSMAPGGIETYTVPGDHLTLTREPNVRDLAAQVEACACAAGDQQTLTALQMRSEPALN